MKYDLLLNMLFDLLNKRKVTAPYFAEKYGLSVRTVYRYVDILSLSVPVEVKSGRGGGIYISDSYKLPVGFLTREEFRAADEALEAMYSQLPEERFLKAREKLTASRKDDQRSAFFSGVDLLIDGGSWGDSRYFSEKLRLLGDAAKHCEVVEIVYFSREGERTTRKIEPHTLVYKQNVWYAYAFCRKQNAFRLFRVGRIYSTLLTKETFERKEVKREDIPLRFWQTEERTDVLLSVLKDAFADVQDWLGCESLRLVSADDVALPPPSSVKTDESVVYAYATLPFDDSLVKKIVSLGAGVKVLQPQALKERVASLASEIAKNYE